MSANAKLSPAMRTAMLILNRNGFIRTGDGVKSGTIVALMNRGILREAGSGSGHVHFPATTPAQVEDEAYAEDARRTAEQAAYLADNTTWMQCTPGGDELDAHTRQTRDGQTLLIVQQRGSLDYWHVYVGDAMKFSTFGSWAEVRRAADDFERDAAHADALEMDEIRTEWYAEVDAEDAARKAAQVEQSQPFAAGDVVHDRATRGGSRPFGTVLLVDGKMIKVSWPGSVGWHAADELDRHSDEECMTVDPAVGPDHTGGAFTEAVENGWGQPDGMLGATEADLLLRADLTTGRADRKALSIVPNTPAEARTGMSDRAAAALTDVAILRTMISDIRVLVRSSAMDHLDRIEAALRGAR